MSNIMNFEKWQASRTDTPEKLGFEWYRVYAEETDARAIKSETEERLDLLKEKEMFKEYMQKIGINSEELNPNFFSAFGQHLLKNCNKDQAILTDEKVLELNSLYNSLENKNDTTGIAAKSKELHEEALIDKYKPKRFQREEDLEELPNWRKLTQGRE